MLGDSTSAPEISHTQRSPSGKRVHLGRQTDRGARPFPHPGVAGSEKSFSPEGKHWPGNKASALDAGVLMTRGPHPSSPYGNGRAAERRSGLVRTGPARRSRPTRARPPQKGAGLDPGICSICRVRSHHGVIHGRHGNLGQDVPFLLELSQQPGGGDPAGSDRAVEEA